MELDRLDYSVLSLLIKRKCTTFFKSMTIREMYGELNTTDITAYRKVKRLNRLGYVEKGCKAAQADSWYLTEKGVGLIQSIGS